MLKLHVSPKAISDLEEIFDYTKRTWSLSQAEKYHDELYSGMLELGHDPSIGKAYFFKKGNYRYLNVNRHLIFYRYTLHNCIIIRVLHEAMDLNAHLL